MKKKYKILIIVLVLITIAAIVLWYQMKKELRLIGEELEMSKLEQSKSYFNKKTECEKYAKIIKEEIDKKKKGMFGELFGSDFFQMVFYSPKEDSCLYVIERLSESGREYYIHNVLTHHKITSFRFPEQLEHYKKFLLEYSNGEIRL